MADTALARYATEAASPVMRELAACALKRGFTQHSLARSLGKTSPNVSRYFESNRPQRETMNAIARVLGLDLAYADLLFAQRLGGNDAIEDAEGMLRDDFKAAEHAFHPGTRPAAMQFLQKCSDHRKHDILFNYVMSKYRNDAKIASRILDWPATLPHALGTFADCVSPDFDLRSRIRTVVPKHEQAFFELYSWCLSHVDSHRNAEEILEVVRLTMRQRGIPYDRLDEYLQADLLYKAGQTFERHHGTSTVQKGSEE